MKGGPSACSKLSDGAVIPRIPIIIPARLTRQSQAGFSATGFGGCERVSGRPVVEKTNGQGQDQNETDPDA